MLEEPYRWVEAIRNRREYVEDQLRKVSPVVGLTYADGLLLLTTTPGPRKLFEIYDQIAFAGVGHPADLEKLRKAAIDIAHLEGFNLSASDVSLPRLVNFGLGPLMKAAFDEIFRSPFIARVLMAELDPRPEGGGRGVLFYTLEADGSFAPAGPSAAIAGTEAAAADILRYLAQHPSAELPLAQALAIALEAWGSGRLLQVQAGQSAGESDPVQVRQVLRQALAEQRVEAAVLDRSLSTRSKFRLLLPDELQTAIAACTA